MDIEKNSGSVLEDLEKDEDKEQEENEKAAQDAMKDLDVCYGDEQSQKEQQKAEDAISEETGSDSVERVMKKQDSIVTLMRGNSLQSLATTGSGLDSLIGATGALELADGDTEYLKKYSEKVAAEAD